MNEITKSNLKTVAEIAALEGISVEAMAKRIERAGVEPTIPKGRDSAGHATMAQYDITVVKDGMLKSEVAKVKNPNTKLAVAAQVVADLSHEQKFELSMGLIASMLQDLKDGNLRLQNDNEQLQIVVDMHAKHLSVLRWSDIHEKGWDVETKNAVGRSMSKYCRQNNHEITKVRADDRAGRYTSVNSYPVKAWEEWAELYGHLF